MRQAIVSVRDRDGGALGTEALLDVFRAAGIDDLEVLSCEGARGVVRIDVETAIDEDRLDDHPAVAWYERVAGSSESRSDTGTSYLVEFDRGDADDENAACDDALVRCETVAVDDASVTVGMTGPQEAIGDTIAAYRDAGATVSLETLGDYEPGDWPADALTRRQREIVEVAYDLGYFDVPRRASTADVAAELDLDPSTVSEHLQRAERNVFATVLDG